MQVHPRALLVSAVFIALLWFAIARGFGVLTIAFEAVFGWGLWQLFAEEWPGPMRRERPLRVQNRLFNKP
jgi:hypothetical protein